LASNTLSHRHFTTEPDNPEYMSREQVYEHSGYLWDRKVLDRMRKGRTRELIAVLPEFMDMAVSEVKAGSLAWMLSALDFPSYPAEVYGYWTVIGTGNAVVAGIRNCKPRRRRRERHDRCPRALLRDCVSV